MQRLAQPATRRLVRLPAAGIVATVVGVLAMTGCTEIPDYANPVEWYNSAVGVFSEDVPPPPLPAEEIPGAHEPFPSVGDMPESPSHEVQLSELEAVDEGLAADRENAQYTEEVIRSGAESETLAQPTNQPSVEPAPPPVPAPEPVAQAASQPLPEPPPLPEPQPAPQPSVVAQAGVQVPALQPMPAPAAVPGEGSRGGVDVKTLFTSLFQSSGPRAVAPPASQTQVALASIPGSSPVLSTLPSTSSLTVPAVPGAGAASYGGVPSGSAKAAVIYFALGSARLTKEGLSALRKVADLQKRRGGTIRVVGHASKRTRELSAEQHELVNFEISFKRARAVADELIRRGVPPDRVIVIARSDSEPVYHEWMPSGEAGNRRAEVYIDF